MQRLLRLKKTLKNSSITAFVENYRSQKNENRYRELSEGEIEALKLNGNRCDDWTLIRVEQAFTPERIFNTVFVGTVYLPVFYGTLLLPGDVSFPTGIYNSLLHNCVIENALISRVAMLSNVQVCCGAVLQNVGTIVSSGKVRYTASLSVGNECGGRCLKVFPDVSNELLDMQVAHSAEELLAEYGKLLETWESDVRLPFGVIGAGAVVSNVSVIRNSFVGAHARVEGAAKIRNSIVLSSLEEPTGIYDSVILENSFVQESVMIHSSAIVKEACILKRAKVGKKALVSSSVISAGCHVEEAEVTNSYVGPLAQMHHHSLLIAAVWPSGCGNIGYGANVGSNHTGRRPDQEIHPGLGMFFGLGVNIKFPANFRESPYSMVASGVTTMPQRLQMPFSLVMAGEPQKYGLRAGLNEVVPGWVYSKNQYSLARNLHKYASRGKGAVPSTLYALFSSYNVKNVVAAYVKLRDVKLADVYTEEQIPGLGSNYLREPVRQLALKAYRSYLERYIYEVALTAVEADSSLFVLSLKEVLKTVQGEAFKEKLNLLELPSSMTDVLKRYRVLLKEFYDGVTAGLERDRARGRRIFDDYDAVHPEDKEFLDFVHAQYDEQIRRTNILLKESRDDG